MTLSHAPSCVVSSKEKEKKRNINNNLAILLSYDSGTSSQLHTKGLRRDS